MKNTTAMTIQSSIGAFPLSRMRAARLRDPRYTLTWLGRLA
ncbi:MAG TPA: hypothetical protein VGJ39_13150 [Vicinamibacterales bacterium]